LAWRELSPPKTCSGLRGLSSDGVNWKAFKPSASARTFDKFRICQSIVADLDQALPIIHRGHG
jgi:hypothetical protein